MHGYDTYDYGARGYYAASGRFMTVDPLAEKYYSISPYAYCGGDPVNRIDPTGMSEFDWHPETEGSNNWIADNGDSDYTLSIQKGISLDEAKKLFSNLNRWDNGKDKNGIVSTDGHMLNTGDDYHDSFGYALFGELVSGKIDDRGYGPWNPDAIQLEAGVSAKIAGVANYSAGIGLISSGRNTGISVATSGTPALNLSDLLDFKELKMVKFGAYFSFNMFVNHTNNSQSLDAYRNGGVSTTVGLGIGLTHGQAANANTAFATGPFAPASSAYYDSYGFTLNSGFGFSRAPTYTWIWEPFK